MANKRAGKLTRRGFVAMAAAVALKPRGPGLSTLIAEGINPEWDGTFRHRFRHRQHMLYSCSTGTGWLTEYWSKDGVPQQSPYWHGLPPVVKLDLKRPWLWEKNSGGA